MKTGKEVWRTAEPDSDPGKAAETADDVKRRRTAPPESGKKKKKGRRPKGAGGGVGPGTATLVVKDGVVLSLRGSNLAALSAKDGETLWSDAAGGGFRSPGDVFVINNLVWTGKSFSTGRDLKTGEVKKTLDVAAAIQTAGHHCRSGFSREFSDKIASNSRLKPLLQSIRLSPPGWEQLQPTMAV